MYSFHDVSNYVCRMTESVVLMLHFFENAHYLQKIENKFNTNISGELLFLIYCNTEIGDCAKDGSRNFLPNCIAF